MLQEVVAAYQPSAVVLQCGADSLAGDRLGTWSLSSRGHGGAVARVAALGLPTLVLGGGGYTARNVARCWTYETSLLAGVELPDSLPSSSEYLGYFSPLSTLHPELKLRHKDKNTREHLVSLVAGVRHQLGRLVVAPSVQMRDIPEAAVGEGGMEGVLAIDSDSDD